MRPRSIRNFDYLYLGALVLSIISFAINFGAITAEIQRDAQISGIDMGSGVAIGAFAFGIVVSLAIWFLISRLRIGFVKWVLVVFFIIGLMGLPAVVSNALSLNGVLSLIVAVMQALAIYFLFQSDAKAWFAGQAGDGSGTGDL